jgi:hypothetical protein
VITTQGGQVGGWTLYVHDGYLITPEQRLNLAMGKQ